MSEVNNIPKCYSALIKQQNMISMRKFLLNFIFGYLLFIQSYEANSNELIDRIFNLYMSNVARFDLQFKGKSLEVVGTVERVESFDQPLSYKESSRERWGYLTTFTVDGKQAACFSRNPDAVSFASPDQAALFTGHITDVVDGRLILTYCSIHDPILATKNFDKLQAREAAEDAMLCKGFFEPRKIIGKLISEKYLTTKPIDFGEMSSTFGIKKPFSMFGAKVTSVEAYDFSTGTEDPLFHRSPGCCQLPFISFGFDKKDANKIKENLKRNNINVQISYTEFENSNIRAGLSVGVGEDGAGLTCTIWYHNTSDFIAF